MGNGSIDLNTWKMKEYPVKEQILTNIIEDKAGTYPDRVIFQFDDLKISFKMLNENINRAANGFKGLGIKKGDKVAIMMPNCPEFLYTWFGLNKIGAIEVPINTALKGAPLHHQLTQSDSIGIVADVEFLERVESLEEKLPEIDKLVLWAKPDTDIRIPKMKFNCVKFSELMESPSTKPEADVRFNDVVSVLYTSGTTGPAKGVQMTNTYWYSIWSESVKYCGYVPSDILYTGLPFFHGNAQGLTVGSAIMADARAAIDPRFTATAFWDRIRKYGATEFNYIGGMPKMLLNQPKKPDEGDHTCRIAVGGGMTEDVWAEFRDRFNIGNLVEVYGMTECYCCLASPHDEVRLGSCGKPITGWDVKIVDDDDMECPTGVPGEFTCRPERDKSWLGTTGYYNMPAATAKLFKNLWIHTGDLGHMDEDGYFYFHGRKKEAIRRRGENITPHDIEKAIGENPAVNAVAVVGVPSEVGEEEVKVSVVLREDHELDPVDLMKWCEDRLAYFMIPRFVEFRDSLPMTGSERVEKYKLKAEGVENCWDREKEGYVLKR
ncbi:MAG: AMP-binding protein [Desulfobacterales bacterium]|jgi:carnitine-CoA ligase|nr:AMP-binding protein [Desulfobacterales bacterium]